MEKTITNRKPTPWNNDDIKGQKLLKEKLKKKWRKNKYAINLAIVKEKRNHYNTLLNELRAKDLANSVRMNKGNSKALFKIVNSALNRKQDLPLPPNTDRAGA